MSNTADSYDYLRALWAQRVRQGTAIPKTAIVDYQLELEFDFIPAESKLGEFYTGTMKQAPDDNR